MDNEKLKKVAKNNEDLKNIKENFGYGLGQMKDILTLADAYAKKTSTCAKTDVGCYLVEESSWRRVISKGSNCGERNCKKQGCKRIEVYGDNSKTHRHQNNWNTGCCNHSEIDALANVTEGKKYLLNGATAFITRYPCLNCTKALVEAGIKQIIYGREFEIESETAIYLKKENIKVLHINDWNCDFTDINN